MSDDDTFDAVIVTNPNLPPSKKAKAKRAQLTADLARQGIVKRFLVNDFGSPEVIRKAPGFTNQALCVRSHRSSLVSPTFKVRNRLRLPSIPPRERQSCIR
jgi:hypothetical protein